MHQPALEGVLQTRRCLANRLARVRHVQAAMSFDDSPEVLAVDKIHHQIVDAVDLAGVVGSNDVGMVESADRPHLVLEAPNADFVHVAGSQDFERDHLAEFDVAGLVNRSHAAIAQFFEHLVLSDALVLKPQGNFCQVIGVRRAAFESGRGLAQPPEKIRSRFRVGPGRRRGCRYRVRAFVAQTLEPLLASRANLDMRLDRVAVSPA